MVKFNRQLVGLQSREVNDWKEEGESGALDDPPVWSTHKNTKTATRGTSHTLTIQEQKHQQDTKHIPVFYNLFVHPTNATEITRVQKLVSEQLATLRPTIHWPIYVHSIGRRLAIPNTTLLGHHLEGTEMITLHSLWEYCKRHTQDEVIYLHSKGSYHDRTENDKLRRFMTLGAVQCSTIRNNNNTLPTNCDVCSSRFSPYPHPHTSGNMWLARCKYVTKLIDPLEFERKMEDVPMVVGLKKRFRHYLVGRGRFAAEHWIYSHPSGQPCDLHTGNFSCGYKDLPEFDTTTTNDDVVGKEMFDLRLAPRFQYSFYNPLEELKPWTGLAHRLHEYRVLYNESPSSSWWGWRLEEWKNESAAHGIAKII
jgi:hypothetical protein